MTIEDKLKERRRYVLASFLMMCIMPLSAVGLKLYGISVSDLSGIIGTASATFSALIIGHFATTPKNTG
jgi:hypothetical protein